MGPGDGLLRRLDADRVIYSPALHCTRTVIYYGLSGLIYSRYLYTVHFTVHLCPSTTDFSQYLVLGQEIAQDTDLAGVPMLDPDALLMALRRRQRGNVELRPCRPRLLYTVQRCVVAAVAQGRMWVKYEDPDGVVPAGCESVTSGEADEV